MPQPRKPIERITWSNQDRKDVLDVYLVNWGKPYRESKAEISKLATNQKRSTASIEYKLQNFSFLDLRNESAKIQGLRGFSKRDVICWRRNTKLPLSNRSIERIREKGWSYLLNDNEEPTTVITTGSICSALLTKSFVILTGPSGTGKTRGAIELAEAICDEDYHELVAVGADWTDNRHVLGYLNPLETTEVEQSKFPIYETTPILELILHANENPQPHVLILDEMNLSHVERYFADILSAMELEDKSGALKLHAAGTAVTRTGVPVPGSIDFPTNLFVIGTVNIDETTYMFSPKVLDRANVIEIHAEETALGNFLKGIESGGGGPEAKDYGVLFLDAAHVIQTEEEHPQVPLLPPTVRDAAADRLLALFRIMKRGRGEYGFRTGKEVMAYLRTAHFLAGPEEATRAEARRSWAHVKSNDQDANPEPWLEALDAQILQKILPKLHGSRSRLAPLLGALATYCASGEEAHAMEHFPQDGAAAKRSLQDARGLTALKFKNSYEKLDRMISVLVEEQFVSFIC